MIHLIIHPPNLNTQFNSYSVSSEPLEIGPELTMDYPSSGSNTLSLLNHLKPLLCYVM